MDEFHHCGQFMMMDTLIAEGTGSEQHQRGPHALSTAIDDVFRHLADEYDIGVETVANDGVYGFHVGPDEGIELFERHSEQDFDKASNLRRRG